MLITFILLGKYLEAAAKGRTSDAITKLMQLTPATAILLEVSCTPLLTWATVHAVQAGDPCHVLGTGCMPPSAWHARPSLSSPSGSHLTGARLLQTGSGCCVGDDALPSRWSMW